MATSYTNPEGSGNRTATTLITVAGLVSSNGASMLDGTTGSGSLWFSAGSGCSFEFWFPSKKVIDEAKFHQGGTATHGTWQWQGSQDRLAWTNLGGTFTLGGATAQTITALSGNVTAYVFYRVVQTAGATNGGPFIHEWEFKVDDGGTTSYLSPLGSGNRTATIAVTASGISAAGGLSAIVDGNRTGGFWWNNSANAGHWITFDLGAKYVVQQARFILSQTSTQGDWKFQGSVDNTVWVDLSATFALGATIIATIAGFDTNTTAYRYYRLLGVAGNRTDGPFEYEFEFMVAATATPDATTAARVTQAAIELLSEATVPVRVTQDAVEVLALNIVPARITQYAIEVLHTFDRWKLWIAGAIETPRVDSLSITWALNERTRASAVISDLIPDRYAEILSTHKNGVTLMFGGLILSRTFTGRNQYDPDFQVTIDCGDWFAATDWVHATLTYAAEVTLKAVLEDLVDQYLAQYGITVDPFQSDGPTLAPFSWAAKRVSDAIRELTDRTGYVATMSPLKRLRMIFPGTIAAPFAITEGATHIQELSWRDHDAQAGSGAVNTVKVICGPTGLGQIGGFDEAAWERHYGDGVNRIFELDAPFVAIIGAVDRSDEPGGYPLALYNVELWPDGQNYPYSYDPAINSIRQRADQPVIPAGEYLAISYMASFPITVTASCPEMGGSPAPPVIEHVEVRTDVMSRPVGQEIADALLASLGGCAGDGDGPPQVITLTTDEDGLEVGQALSVDLPTTRSISGEFVITSVAMSIVLDPDADTAPYWVYTVEAQDSDLYQGSYLTDWRKLTGTGVDAGAGGGGTVPTGGVGAVMKSPSFLGGSRGVSVSASPAAWLPVVNYVTFAAPVSFLARVRVELFAFNSGITAQARLYNLTDAAVVATSSIVTSTTAVAVSFGADVVIGKSYRLEVIAGTAAEGVFAIGTIEAA